MKTKYITWTIKTALGLCIFPLYIPFVIVSSINYDDEVNPYLSPWYREELRKKRYQEIKRKQLRDIQLRNDLGYPPIKYVEAPCGGKMGHPKGTMFPEENNVLPRRNLSGIFFKYGKYPGTLRLTVGGQVICEIDNQHENLLYNVGGPLLLELCKYHEACIEDSLEILVASDFTYEYYTEVIDEDITHTMIDGSKIKYMNGMLGKTL